MKAFRVLTKSIRDAFKSVFRNFSLSTASIVCSSITLILVAAALIVSYNVKDITKELEHELSIIVYLKKDTSSENITVIKSKLNNMENIDKFEFKSKDEWKLEMKNSSESLNTTLEYLEENPLLDSFVVTVKDANLLKPTAEEIKKIEFVSSADYGEGMTESLVKAFNVLEKVTIIIVVSLVLVTIFLIGNTIKLTIFSRRNEIEIMRLVGASNISIKLPFIFEGFILGLLGSIIPVLLSIYGYIIMYDHFNGYLFSQLIKLIKPFNFILYISIALLFIGTLIGMFGSYRAVRKYLKI